VFGNFSLFKDSLPRTELHPYLFCLSLYLLYFFLPPFEDNGLLFWVPGVPCWQSEEAKTEGTSLEVTGAID